MLTWPAPEDAYVLSEQQARRGGGGECMSVFDMVFDVCRSAGIACYAWLQCCRCPAEPADPPPHPSAYQSQVLFYTLDCLPILLSFLPFIFMHPGYLLPDMPPKGSLVAPSGKAPDAAVEAEAGQLGGSESSASGLQEKSPKGGASEGQQQFQMVVLAEPAQ